MNKSKLKRTIGNY